MSKERITDSDSDIHIVPEVTTIIPSDNEHLSEEIANLPARMQVTKDSEIIQYPTNLDISKDSHKALFLNSLTVHDITLEVGECFDMDIYAYVAHPLSKVDEETNIVKYLVRMVLIGVNGKFFATTSGVVISRVNIMSQLYTPEQWAKGIPVTLTARKSKRPNRVWHDITIRT